jgi:hypothetical protein
MGSLTTFTKARLAVELVLMVGVTIAAGDYFRRSMLQIIAVWPLGVLAIAFLELTSIWNRRQDAVSSAGSGLTIASGAWWLGTGNAGQAAVIGVVAAALSVFRDLLP